MSDESAFVRVFKHEMAHLAHASLVETYVWANSTGYGTASDDLKARGEAWAKQIEDAGKTSDVLEALARSDDESGMSGLSRWDAA